ncbi:MAG: hypothetical protein EKK56_00835 [Flavobacteriaceae bacterium]|nr:MAG: hypothetical protein EKK56_00835 [Flavobacteriaceae bacterium]
MLDIINATSQSVNPYFNVLHKIWTFGISNSAKIIYFYLCSKPQAWFFSPSLISYQVNLSRRKTYAAFNELISVGVINRKTVRNRDGTFDHTLYSFNKSGLIQSLSNLCSNPDNHSKIKPKPKQESEATNEDLPGLYPRYQFDHIYILFNINIINILIYIIPYFCTQNVMHVDNLEECARFMYCMDDVEYESETEEIETIGKQADSCGNSMEVFEELWKIYPYKAAKSYAFKQFLKLSRKLYTVCTDAIREQVAQYEHKKKLGLWVPKWKFLGNWLKKKCWLEKVKTYEELLAFKRDLKGRGAFFNTEQIRSVNKMPFYDQMPLYDDLPKTQMPDVLRLWAKGKVGVDALKQFCVNLS